MSELLVQRSGSILKYVPSSPSSFQLANSSSLCMLIHPLIRSTSSLSTPQPNRRIIAKSPCKSKGGVLETEITKPGEGRAPLPEHPLRGLAVRGGYPVRPPRRFLSHAEARNRPLRVGATHGEATKPSEARAERRGDVVYRQKKFWGLGRLPPCRPDANAAYPSASYLDKSGFCNFCTHLLEHGKYHSLHICESMADAVHYTFAKALGKRVRLPRCRDCFSARPETAASRVFYPIPRSFRGLKSRKAL